MREEGEIIKLILEYAKSNPLIKAVTLEGSRSNTNIPKDKFQDYDITFIVDRIEPFRKDDKWLAAFGNMMMLQKPEDMELFPAEIIGFSYLMMFDDYNKIDLTLVPIESLDDYLKSDKLIKVLLDKEGIIQGELIPTDVDYHIKKPTARMYDDCCNEFWNVTPYVVKGLCRKEILFAIDHLHIVRQELLRMLSWQIGIEYGFTFSIGKNYKFIDQYISEDIWKKIRMTYRMDTDEHIWEALFLCHELFRETASKVGTCLVYTYPEYDTNISRYVRDMYESSKE